MHDGKSRLRREVFARLERLSRGDRLAKSRVIMARLFSLEEVRAAKVVQFYCSFRNEVMTDEMITAALAQGKRVAVPAVHANGRLRLGEVKHPARDLLPGRFRILEPRPPGSSRRPVTLRQVEVAVVPGLAFDARGHRLGRGTGHFDRFLARRPPGLSVVALAYEAQVVEHVPVTHTDIPVDIIVTEKRVIRCRRRRNAG